MFQLLRHYAAQALRNLLKRTGRTIVPIPPPWGREGAIYHQISQLHPDVVLDVGANEGQFVTCLRAAGYAGRVISFEPQVKPYNNLISLAAKDTCWESHRLALGDAPGVMSMHISGFSQSSSLLSIGQSHIALMPETAEVGREEVEVVRLDEWAGPAALSGLKLFLKLDVQGFELPVLCGAGELLNSVVGVLAELNFKLFFDGQSKYHEVMGFLESAGLRFVRLANICYHPKTGDLLWADALFVRENQFPSVSKACQ